MLFNDLPRKNSSIRFNYTMSGSSLVPLNKPVNELGFVFDPKLHPSLHIEQVCCKALKTLGFVKQVASEFKLVSSSKVLYCSLVRTILEYGSVIWDPQMACNSVMLERVQRQFFNYFGNTLKIECPNHDYKPVLKFLKLYTLANHRQAANLTFLAKLLQGKIDSPYLLSQVSIPSPNLSPCCSFFTCHLFNSLWRTTTSLHVSN